MLKRVAISLIVILFGFQAQSQNIVLIDTIKDFSSINGYLVQALIEEGDTLIHIPLKAVIIRPPFKFKSRRQQRRYSRLVLYVKKSISLFSNC
jgi:hypothetical protein